MLLPSMNAVYESGSAVMHAAASREAVSVLSTSSSCQGSEADAAVATLGRKAISPSKRTRPASQAHRCPAPCNKEFLVVSKLCGLLGMVVECCEMELPPPRNAQDAC